MIDINKKYRTVGGQEVVLYTVDGRDKTVPVVGEVCFADGWEVVQWDGNGKCAGPASRLDLVEVPETKSEVVVKIEGRGHMSLPIAVSPAGIFGQTLPLEIDGVWWGTSFVPGEKYTILRDAAGKYRLEIDKD